MLERKFRGPWQEAFREADRHKAEFLGKEIELTVTSQESIESNSETLAEGLKEYIGIIESDSGNWSQNGGEKFRAYLEEKRRKGTL